MLSSKSRDIFTDSLTYSVDKLWPITSKLRSWLLRAIKSPCVPLVLREVASLLNAMKKWNQFGSASFFWKYNCYIIIYCNKYVFLEYYLNTPTGCMIALTKRTSSSCLQRLSASRMLLVFNKCSSNWQDLSSCCKGLKMSYGFKQGN